jgi:hypothetical protein
MKEPANVWFGRFEEPHIYRHPVFVKGGPILILDLWGERAVPPLRDRLLPFVYHYQPKLVLLRGLSSDLEDEARSEQGQLDLTEAFPGAAVYKLSVGSMTTPDLLIGPATSIDQELLIKTARESEIAALLQWSDAVWSDPNYHFVVPSGYHADKFVRVGDLFGEPLHVSRVADWFEGLSKYSYLISDTVSLLPLLQELRVRNTKSTGEDIPVRVVPYYGAPEDQISATLEEIAPIARESGKPLLFIVSVSATGGYIRNMEERLLRHPDLPSTQFTVICQVGGERGAYGLTFIESDQYPRRDLCRLCKSKSLPIEIDERKFTTRLGSRLLDFPRPAVMQENAPVIVDIARKVGAFRVHVSETERHGHLTIHIDTRLLLESEIFLAYARIGFSRCLLTFRPNLILVPSHRGTGAVQKWLADRDYPDSLVLPREGDLSNEIRAAIEDADNILICDDFLITSRTLRAALETVQMVKEAAKLRDYKLRAFVLVARPASKELWTGIQKRFYIDNQNSLFAGWEVNLPDRGFGDRDTCPWCAELALLERLLPVASVAARSYLEQRIERLQDPQGLDGYIYFGSEVAARLPGWDTAVHTSPSSYLGTTTDIGAFVSIAALIQKMRTDWDSNVERWSTAYAIPLHTSLQYFTDPVIASALLRSTYPHEVRSAAVIHGMTETFARLNHARQNPVFSAEIILAAEQGKLPRDVDYSPMLDALPRFPHSEQAAVNLINDGPPAMTPLWAGLRERARSWFRRLWGARYRQR